MNKVCDNIEKGIQATSDTIAYSVNNKEPFDKAVKTVLPIFEVIAKFTGNTPVSSIVSLLKNVKDLTGALNIFDRIDEWLNSGRRDGVTKQLPKALSRGFLTVAHGIDTLQFLDKMNIISIGNVPVLGHIKNVVVLVSAGFSIWSYANDLKDYKKIGEHAGEKLNVWRNISNEFRNDQTKEATLQKIQDKNIRKSNKYYDLGQIWTSLTGYVQEGKWKSIEDACNRRMRQLSNNLNAGQARKPEKKQRALKFWENISRVAQKVSDMIPEDQIKVSNQLEKVFKDEKNHTSLKLKKWTRYQEAASTEAGAERLIDYKINGKWSKTLKNNIVSKKRSWIAIAAEIAKIFIVSLVMILAFANVITLTGSFIALAAVGFISQGLGLVKTLYKKFGPQYAPIHIFRLNPAAA